MLNGHVHCPLRLLYPDIAHFLGHNYVQDCQGYQKLIIRHIKHNFQKKMISKVFTLKKVQSSQIYDDICK